MAVSYSGLSLYKQCPSAFQRKYIIKEEVEQQPASPALALLRGSAIHKEIEEYLLGQGDLTSDTDFYREFLDGLISEGATAENKFAFTDQWEPCEFDAEEAMIRGIDDACVIDGETAYVYDWKTGKIYAEHENQRALYGLAALLTYPMVEEAHVIHVYLDQRKNAKSVYHRDQVEGYKWFWERQINKTKPPQPYPAIPSFKCKWCPYSSKHGTGSCTSG